VKWVRSEKVLGPRREGTGLWVYTSTCGRFDIRQRRDGGYVLDVDGQPAVRSDREHDTLRDAKDVANMIADPDYEPT